MILLFPAGISCISRFCPDVDSSSLFYEKKGSKSSGFGTDFEAIKSERLHKADSVYRVTSKPSLMQKTS